MTEIESLLRRQSGVVARPQLRALGLAPHDVRRLLRRRELVRLHPGVYLDHTGQATWEQQAWAAVLALWPAALCHRSALEAAEVLPRVPGSLHVAIDRDRSPDPPAGVRQHRLASFEAKVQWNLSPPRVRLEEAALDVASGADDDLTAIATLADVVRSRRTTAGRLQQALHGRVRIARRGFLDDVLDDVGTGTCSVLEHRYLTRVERPHGLPRAVRQVRECSAGTVYRDVVYADFDTYVELDGRLFHDTTTQRDSDLERDLDLVVRGRATLRLGWGQVIGRPCSTAHKVGRLLRSRGWVGSVVRCPSCPDDPARYAGAAW